MGRHPLVTGATGTLGKRVAPAAVAAGHQVRALSRRDRTDDSGTDWRRGDLLAGTGVDDAADGVEVVVNCATQPTGDKDVKSVENLIAAARRAGVDHIVHVSIIGIDRIPLPYCKTKLRVERTLEASEHRSHRAARCPVPRIDRDELRDPAFSPVLWPLRGVRFQPVDTRDVAARLVELADAEPSGRVADIGGPAVHPHADLARMFVAARGSRRGVVRAPVPRRIVAGYRAGANLAPDNAVGTIGFKDYLAEAK